MPKTIVRRPSVLGKKSEFCAGWLSKPGCDSWVWVFPCSPKPPKQTMPGKQQEKQQTLGGVPRDDITVINVTYLHTPMPITLYVYLYVYSMYMRIYTHTYAWAVCRLTPPRFMKGPPSRSSTTSIAYHRGLRSDELNETRRIFQQDGQDLSAAPATISDTWGEFLLNKRGLTDQQQFGILPKWASDSEPFLLGSVSLP